MKMDVEWFEPIGEFEINWQERGAEWVRRIQAISGHSGATGYGERGFGRPSLIEVRPNGSENDDPRLLVIPHDGGTVTVGLAGNSSEFDGEVASYWLQVTEQATAELEAPATPHKWTALIGQRPSKIATQTIKLASPGRAPDMQLTSSENELWEPVSHAASSLNSWTVSVSIPIRMHGSTSAHTWDSAQKRAAGNLNRLVALLSLAWDVTVDVREHPTPLEWGEHQTPRYPAWAKHVPEDPPPLTNVASVNVPQWIDAAWKKLRTHKKLDSAISMHMEGLRIEDDHPSLALVAFVSCVEVISLMIYREDRCTECRGHTKIADKFRETLRLVTEEAEAEYLHHVYDDRSRTVHNGRLHGGELMPGFNNLSIFPLPPEFEFQHGILSRMKSASRKLLLMALRDELPRARIRFGQAES
ncbi:hypothetical protein [Streptomyces sp. NPDC005407]|uniref:hypothetical protein n=1 Tax=Streptomyces sp. NPDC005407 TaxID=3155340 RepID=UPI0033AAACC2